MKILRRVLILLAVLLVLPVPARAAETNLTLLHELEGEPLSDAVYELYLLDKDYADGLTAYNAVVKAGKKPDYTAVTGTDGKARFSGLKDGAYLLVGQSHKVGDKLYCLGEKSLLTFPYKDASGNPVYDLTMQTKYPVKNADETAAYEVIKIWKDKADARQPDHVKVELYRNRKLYETVILTGGSNGTSAGANWRYSWTDTDPSADWTVVEVVPEGYEDPVYSRQGNTFTITNTLKTTSSTVTDSNLPQTGQLWWPVPILALSGIFLLLMGWIRRKESCDEA